MSTILIIDDERAIRDTLDLHFRDRGFDIRLAATADEALADALDREVDLVVSDIRMPGRDGLSLLQEVVEKRPGLPVIIMTAYHDLDNTIAAMQGGAVDYIPKPIDIEKLDAAVDAALRRTTGDGSAMTVGVAAPSATVVGRSAAMGEVFKSIGLVAQSRATVLILGESGTGKEVIARAVHTASPDRDKPFIAINCAALVETLLESELFGHERGAFTGAYSAHVGKVEMVGDGTLFLDEIAELSPPMQGKLLRVLEAREYSPVGSTAVKKSNARFIAATNVDLAERVAKGEFREDLYYRLNVVTMKVPPLRKRPEDIPQLVDHLLRRINRDLCKNVRQVAGELMEKLTAYSWPGNVRQLENVLMRAAVMARGDTLTSAGLPAELVGDMTAAPDAAAGGIQVDGPYCSLRDLERAHIEKVLAATGWHKGRACDILGISRPTLERKIKDFGLKAERD